jgi:uncharacterized membrane protein HdeD (DUF308 family)
MELKYYDKPWLPAFKGAFLIIFGIIAMLGIVGTIKTLATFFAVLIAIIGILLIATGLRYKNSRFRGWTITSGIINLLFFAFLVFQVDKAKDINEARAMAGTLMLIWLLFYSVTEIVEAILLYTLENAFSVLFLMNALLTLLFAYFMYVVTGNFTEQGVFYIGIIALVFGIVNELSSYLLSRIKE